MSRKRVWSNGFDLSNFFFQEAPVFIPWHNGYLFFFAMYISNAKFEEHRSNIARYIRDSVFYCFSRHFKEKKTTFCRNDLIFVKVGL